MAFTVPNVAEVNPAITKVAAIDSRDFDVLAAGFAGTGVKSNCLVSAQGPPAMAVDVASGSVYIEGVEVAVAAGSLAVGPAVPPGDRFDLVTVNAAGNKSVVAGTKGMKPLIPVIPVFRVVLAMIYVPEWATVIEDRQVIDKRVRMGLIAPTALSLLKWTGDGTQGTAAPSAFLAVAKYEM